MGVMLGTILAVKSQLLYMSGKILGFAFYGNWVAGTATGKGKSSLEGLISPGIPMLVIFTSGLIFDNGLNGLLNLFSLNYSPIA